MDIQNLTPKQTKGLRDGILFVFGLMGITYETIVEHTDRPTLLIVFAGMAGLPVFLHKDESHTDKLNSADTPSVEAKKEVPE